MHAPAIWDIPSSKKAYNDDPSKTTIVPIFGPRLNYSLFISTLIFLPKSTRFNSWLSRSGIHVPVSLDFGWECNFTIRSERHIVAASKGYDIWWQRWDLQYPMESISPWEQDLRRAMSQSISAVL